MNRLLKCSAALCFTVGSGAALAADQVLEVEIFNSTAQAIVPSRDFSWLQAPENAGHDFVIEPYTSQELRYYLPKSRGSDLFTYQQGEQACLFGFGHLTPDGDNLNRWVQARSTGATPIECTAEQVVVHDDDEFVRNGGTRVIFIMGYRI